MELGLSALPISFAAGILTTLSPCVLPLLPMIIGAATSEHRLGIVALSGGMVLSFTAIGVGLASLGLVVDINPEYFRYAGAILLIVFSLLLMSNLLQEKLSHLTAPLGSSAQNWLSRQSLTGLWGQFIIGLSLGMVWSPCVGPTLGAAISLASQGESLPQVTLIMTLFGLGAIVPMLAIGMVTRQQFTRNREKLMKFAYWSKKVMGVLMFSVAILILTGLDKSLEAYLLEHMPESLMEWSVKY